MSLNLRQQKFLEYYLASGNATQSAIKAGYSKKTSYTIGPRLLENVEIQAAIGEVKQKSAENCGVTTEWIIRNLKRVAERCMQEEKVMYFDYADKELKQKTTFIEDEETGNLKEVGLYEFDSAGANKSLELLGRNQKMFTDKVEHTDGGAVADRIRRARSNAKKPAKS